tara:strand:- start:106 stop:276 length:171 start_codon:yes stop_codon:yes gene_type:complete
MSIEALHQLACRIIINRPERRNKRSRPSRKETAADPDDAVAPQFSCRVQFGSGMNK